MHTSFEDSDVLAILNVDATPFVDVRGEELKAASDEDRIAALRSEIKSIKARIDTRKYRANPITQQKDAARIVVALAVRAGKLTSMPCDCGETKTEAHHDDYSKPLEVRWLCKKCHTAHHRAQKTHCANGHPWVSENTYTSPNGKRQCLTCRQLHYDARPDRMAEFKRMKKENETFKARIERLEADLLECRDFIEPFVDVIDGADGQPAPNPAMRLVSMIDESIHGPGGF